MTSSSSLWPSNHYYQRILSRSRDCIWDSEATSNWGLAPGHSENWWNCCLTCCNILVQAFCTAFSCEFESRETVIWTQFAKCALNSFNLMHLVYLSYFFWFLSYCLPCASAGIFPESRLKDLPDGWGGVWCLGLFANLSISLYDLYIIYICFLNIRARSEQITWNKNDFKNENDTENDNENDADS